MRNKILLLLGLLLLPLNVFAASGSIKASASSSRVTIGNTITVKVKVSSTDTLGSWRYGLSYDKSKLSLISGDTSIVGYGDGTYKSKTYSYKFKAIATGSARITIDNPKIADWNTEAYIQTSAGNLTLTVKEVVIINYSSDNNLKSLSIDGFDITPVFNKNTLEYSATLKPTTTSIKVNATLSDSKAKLSGVGEVEVKEGTNQINVVVTAENGTSKTYVINAVVPEKDPIEHKFGEETYSILRKLPETIPVNFNNATLKFDNEEVPCLQNQTLNLTLIYLRNSKNEESFYIYDEKSDKVTLYNQIDNNELSVYILNDIDNIKGLHKTTLKINGQEVVAYQIKSGSRDYVIKARNVSTGKENLYVYDQDNKTISLFNQEDINYLLDNSNLYKMLLVGLGALLLVLLLIVIVSANNKKKLNAMIVKLQEENRNLEISKEVKNNKKKKEEPKEEEEEVIEKSDE